MLECYFSKPDTLDQIRAAWLGEDIRRYVATLHDQKYSARTIQRRVPVLMFLSEFTQVQGIKVVAQLPPHVESFVDHYANVNANNHPMRNIEERRNFARTTVRHFLGVTLPDYSWKRNRQWTKPFAETVPGYFDYLTQERGLAPASVKLISHNIRRLELYLRRIGVVDLNELSPAILSAFMVDSSQSVGKKGLRGLAANLRVSKAAIDAVWHLQDCASTHRGNNH